MTDRTTDRVCVTGCGRPTADMLCSGCLAELVGALRDLPDLLAELDITLSRQDTRTTRGPGHSAETPLPYRPEAGALASSATATITTWARVVHEQNPHLRPPAGSTADAVAWLIGWPSLLALHPAADELHGDITGLAAQIRYRVDRPPDRVYSGPCGAPTDTGPCPGHLYARVGHGTVVCTVCGAGHDVAERRAWMIESALDMLVTAPVALGWARLLLDHEVPPGTWRSWLSRRRILARGTDRLGRPVYRFGDVVELLADHLRHRRPA
ncbi:hypothetical protein [Actinophytocola sediminis]